MAAVLALGGCQALQGFIDSPASADAIQNAGDIASSFVPAPFGGLVFAAFTTGAALLRARHNRKAAKNIVLSVSDVVKNATTEQRDRIARAQSKAASRIVDQSQGKIRGGII